MPGKIINTEIYELFYRNYQGKAEIKMEIPESTTKLINNTLEVLKNTKAEPADKGSFSDVTYNLFPVSEGKSISYKYFPMLVNKESDITVEEYIARYKNLDLNSLPLIEVARFLNIKVEKSNILESYGQYNHQERKITMGTDDVSTFIHELAHAIDLILPDPIIDKYYMELTAELSAVVICRAYGLPINMPHALCYLNWFSVLNINVYKVIDRVAQIYEYTKKFDLSFHDRQTCYI